MTYPSYARISHYNQLSFGPCHYFTSVSTGKRLVFRANEMESVRAGRFGNAIVRSVEGCEFEVVSRWPEIVS